MDFINLAVTSKQYRSQADASGVNALLEISSNRESGIVSVYGFDNTGEAKAKGIDLGSVLVDDVSFEKIVIQWLAWKFGIKEEDLLKHLESLVK